MTGSKPDAGPVELHGLSEVSTGQIADAMDRLGLPRSACRARWAEIPAHRVVGTAFPIQFRSAVAPADFEEYLDKPAAGDVLMLANAGRDDCAVWGGQRTLSAMRRGIAGTFIDGACRDVEEHRAAGYGVFARHLSPLRSRGVVAPAAVGEPAMFAGAIVRRGDIVVGDATGVIIIPAEHAPAVIAAAMEISELEASRQAQLTGTEMGFPGIRSASSEQKG
jgi:4-hydroxy-4-methyl-2-oxoglutarate aldolase